VWSVYQPIVPFKQQGFEIVSRGTLSCGISQLPGACGDVGMTPVVCSGMHFASNAEYPSEYSRTIEA
jgi:hypothetical protein